MLGKKDNAETVAPQLFTVHMRQIAAGPGFGPFMADKKYQVTAEVAAFLQNAGALHGDPSKIVAADDVISDQDDMKAQIAELQRIIMGQARSASSPAMQTYPAPENSPGAVQHSPSPGVITNSKASFAPEMENAPSKHENINNTTNPDGIVLPPVAPQNVDMEDAEHHANDKPQVTVPVKKPFGKK